MTTLTLNGFELSGHSHRAKVMLSLLGLEADIVQINLAEGEHKQAPFLAKNRFGQVPVLEDGDTTIADSNAILVYLAQRYDTTDRWYPNNPAASANIQRFLAVAAGPLANGPAAARLVTVFGAQKDHEAVISAAHDLLEVFEQHLQGRDWLVGEEATIADVANYTYIAHAPEGGVSLDAYPNVRAWLNRFEALPGFVPMTVTKVGLAA